MRLSYTFIRSLITKPIFCRTQLITSPRFSAWFMHFFKCLPQVSNSGRYTKLHVVLRANDSVMNLSASRHLEEIGLNAKPDVVKLCFPSLAAAIKKFASDFGNQNITTTIVNDNLSSTAKKSITDILSTTQTRFEFVPSEAGNGPTFRKQISIAANDSNDTLVAICEDDYLFDASTFSVAFNLFNTTPRLDGFTPHNHPNIIRLNLPTYIYKLTGRFYQYTTTTTCTFLTGADLIKRCKSTFLKYNGCEENSINKVWKRHICISPCCWTLAEHLHLNDLSPVQTLLKHNLC